jgi:hypothetical protein
MRYLVPSRTALPKTESLDGRSKSQVSLLSATYRRNYRIELVANNIDQFLDIELNVRQLIDVHE